MPSAPPTRRLAKPAGRGRTSKPQVAKRNLPESTETRTEEALNGAFEKKIGFSAETLRGIFTSESPSKEVESLKRLISDRTVDGRRFSLRNWRVYAAIDEAYNAPFNQITPTLIGKILAGDKKLTPEEILKELRRWGLSEETLFTEVQHPTDPRQKVKVLNKETFHKILVPLVKALVNARESKLVTDRDNYPNFVYSANKQTEENKTIGDIITQIVEAMSIGYGFKAVRRAAIHQALKYSFALAFPAEAWHYEKDIDGDGKEYVQKEGMRYNLPHPTRCAWDQNYRPSTLNSDTGCEWACYWNLNRFGDIDSNPAYYNKDKVSFGTCWFSSPYEPYFETVYPCTMELPMPVQEWASSQKREDAAARLYNTNADNDKAVFLTQMFMKLVPKQWGLSDYANHVWVRFVVASDDMVVYAEPLPYSPILYMGTDADDSTSSRTASFALEGIPWQDLVGNILSQHLLAVKQNCVKVIPYDTNQLTQKQIEDITARGRESVAVTWIPVDFRDMNVAQKSIGDMFKPIVFPQTNTAEIIATLNQVFNIMERALGMSAQEVGAIAGHIQTAEEIRTVSQNTSARLDYIGTFIDEFDDAMKRQVYIAYQNFGDEEFTVNVNGVDEQVAKTLKEKFGFELSEAGKNSTEVKGSKNKLSVNAFLSSRENKSRLNQPQLASVIMQTIQIIAANPELAGKVGAQEIMRHLNRAMKMAGAPEDSDFRISPEASDLVEMKRLMQAMQEHAKEITQAATAQASKVAVAAADQHIQQAGEPIGQAIQQTGQAAVVANQKAEAAGQAAMQIEEQVKQLTALVLKMDSFLKAATQPPPPTMPANGPMPPQAMVPSPVPMQ